MEQSLARGCPDEPSSPRAFAGEGAVLQWVRYRALGACKSRRMPCKIGAHFFLFSFFPSFFFPPSYTHRHYREWARAPGGSAAGRRFPGPRFVWGIPKIDCGAANREPGPHADSTLCRGQDLPPEKAWEAPAGRGTPWGARGRGRKARLQGSSYPGRIWWVTLHLGYPTGHPPTWASAAPRALPRVLGAWLSRLETSPWRWGRARGREPVLPLFRRRRVGTSSQIPPCFSRRSRIARPSTCLRKNGRLGPRAAPHAL